MRKSDLIYLNHILNSIKRIEEYTGSIEKSDFLSNHLIRDGTIRQIEIIGETTKNLSKDVMGKYPRVPWSDIVGMRDILIHLYFRVDLQAIWSTVKVDIQI